MRFTINLATKTYLDTRLVNRVSAVCLSLLLALLAWSVSRASWNAGELRRINADIAGYEGRLNSRPAGVSEQDYNSQLATIRFYNGIIARKTYDWLGLLDRLEGVTPDGIAISTLAPEEKSDGLKITGWARSFTQVRAYLEKLEDSKAFADVLLISHRDVTVSERSHGVEFTISCRVAAI